MQLFMEKMIQQIMENLIEKFNKFGIDIDERNIFGFTPLLLAILLWTI